MGGLTFDQRMKQSGIEARKNAEYSVPVEDLWFPPKDDPIYGALAHPREHDELDESLVIDMMSRFESGLDPIEYPALVWNVGPGADGKLRLLTINGCRRDKHGIEVQKRLRASGKLSETDVIRIKIDQWSPPKDATNAEIFAALICERLKQNNDPFKKPDSVRVLSDTVRALRVLGKTDAQIKDHMPKGVGLREIEALAHYDDLHPEARAKFENGAPVGLLPVVLEVPREKHVERTSELLDAGVTSTRGATRVKNTKEKKNAGKPVQKMNAQRIDKIAEFFMEFHNGEILKKKENSEYEIDYTYWAACISFRAANGDLEAIEEMRKHMFGDDAERNDFDRVVGKSKGTGRPRGRPRKNPLPEPVSANPPVDDSEEENEEDEEEDDGENQFAGILDRPDDNDEADETGD